MQMIAQIKQLLPSTRNITTQTKKYGQLLPYLYSYYTGISSFFFFFLIVSAASTFTLLPWVIINISKIQLVVYY